MNAPTFTKTGTKATTAASLDKAIFGVEVTNHDLLKQAYIASLANRRSAAAKTKTRGLVRGGGIKPWRQKGTGRARVGSSRSPIWRSGGIIFGPTGNQNYKHAISSSSKQVALRQALTLAATSKKITIIEQFAATDGKSATAVKLLTKIDATGSVMVVVDTIVAETKRAVSNVAGLRLQTAQNVSAFDVLNADMVLITQPALAALSDRMAGKKVEATS